MKLVKKHLVTKVITVAEDAVFDAPITKDNILSTLDEIMCCFLPDYEYNKKLGCYDKNYWFDVAVQVAMTAIENMPDSFFKEQEKRLMED